MKVNDFLNIVCEALSREPGTLTLDDTPDTVEEWDSLGHLAIVSAVNYRLHVPADDPEVVSFASLGQLAETLRRKAVLEAA